MWHLAYNIRYSVVPIHFSLFNITLYYSVSTTLMYNETKHSVPFMMLQPSLSIHDISQVTRAQFSKDLEPTSKFKMPDRWSKTNSILTTHKYYVPLSNLDPWTTWHPGFVPLSKVVFTRHYSTILTDRSINFMMSAYNMVTPQAVLTLHLWTLRHYKGCKSKCNKGKKKKNKPIHGPYQ